MRSTLSKTFHLIAVLAFAQTTAHPYAQTATPTSQSESFRGDAKAAFDDLAGQLQSGLLLLMPDSSVERYVGTRALSLSGHWPNEVAPVTSRWLKNDASGFLSLDVDRLASTQRSARLVFLPAIERAIPDPILAHLLARARTRVERADTIELRLGEELALNPAKCSSNMILRIRLTSGALLEQEVSTVCMS